MRNYVAYHVHSDDSLLDSCTKFAQYVDRAVELGQTAIASTEHGKPLCWAEKQLYCDKKGIKFIFGVEIYLTASLEEKVRDNYHTVLIAKNNEGRNEINALVSTSTDPEHLYYKNRITFEEFLNVSDNVIKISACVQSPLNMYKGDAKMYERLARHYDYFEIQPHNTEEQIKYNQQLLFMSEQYGKPLIAGTDTHSLDQYKAECRRILMAAKKNKYALEDQLDLTYKSYDELVEMFRVQDAIPYERWMEAISNTNKMADSVEPYNLDLSIKYPVLYGSSETDAVRYHNLLKENLARKLEDGVIPAEQEAQFRANLDEEERVFTKLGMNGFMLCMSELITWCRENDIPVGPGRGSVCGSSAAFVSDVTDVNPVQWHTIFSRFCNEYRVEVGDIDIDCIDTDRPRIFQYIIDRFGQKYTARVPSFGTIADKSAIDEIGRGLAWIWEIQHQDTDPSKNPYSLKNVGRIKKEAEKDLDSARKKYPELFYYYDGIVGTKVSQSIHPAGIVISPVTLGDHYGTFWKDGELCLTIAMDEIHTCGLVKFDFLILRNIKIIRDVCRLAGVKYPRAHEIVWDDQNVWKNMLRSSVGIFQFESDFAFSSLYGYKPHSVFDMSLVTAAIRPSGTSYRDSLFKHTTHKNPSKLLDDLLRDNNGYLVYQEDIIKFLQQICGMNGSEADMVRRGIAKKDMDIIGTAIPKIIDGYCSKSDRPREIAEKEAREFIQIIEDASSYMFGYNHSIAYCLVGYLCAYFRYHYPLEFCTALLNNAANDDDVADGVGLAQHLGFIVSPPRWGKSGSDYTMDKESKTISKGVASVKTLNKAIPEELKNLASSREWEWFSDVLMACKNAGLRSDQRDALIDIDFFYEFGNIPTLRNIVDAMEFFKYGEAKSISKSRAGAYEKFIIPYANSKTKNGKEGKSYGIIDVRSILNSYERYVRDLNMPDLTLSEKARLQMEHLGYADMISGRKEDLRKVQITSKPIGLQSRKTSATWCYRFDCKSLGSGKTVRCSMKPGTFEFLPFKEGDFIEITGMYEDKGGYWWIADYNYIF